MGRMTMGVSAAPTAHEVTGQNEFGKWASEMPNRALMARGALVMTAAFKPMMKVLETSQLRRVVEGDAKMALGRDVTDQYNSGMKDDETNIE